MTRDEREKTVFDLTTILWGLATLIVVIFLLLTLWFEEPRKAGSRQSEAGRQDKEFRLPSLDAGSR